MGTGFLELSPLHSSFTLTNAISLWHQQLANNKNRIAPASKRERERERERVCVCVCNRIFASNVLLQRGFDPYRVRPARLWLKAQTSQPEPTES